MTKDEKIKRLTVKTWAKIQQLRSMYLRSGGTNESFYKERNKIMQEYYKNIEKIREE